MCLNATGAIHLHFPLPLPIDTRDPTRRAGIVAWRPNGDAMTLPNLTESMQLGLLKSVFHTMDDGAMVLDREFNIILANRWIERRYAGETPLAGRKCYSVLCGREDTCEACPFLRSLETGTPQRQVVTVPTGEDEVNWLELCTYPLRDSAGATVGAIEHVRDITTRKQLEEQLQDEMVRRQILVDQSRDGIVVLDLAGKVCEANEQFARMLGYTREELQQLRIWDWDNQTDRGRLIYMLETAEAIRQHFEASYRRKDGTMVQVEVFADGARIGGKRLIFHLSQDVTEKKAMQKQIQDIAVRDPLTDLYNVRYIFARLAEISAEYRRGKGGFSLSIFEIDNFKAVINSHGNKAGDLALKELAQTLSNAVRPYDLLGRFGLERFILVSRNPTAGAETTAMMERIMDMVRKMLFAFEGHNIRFTLSCGLAHSSEFARDAFTINTMVSRAETRLGDAKAGGRDRWVGPPSDGEMAQGVAQQLGADARRTAATALSSTGAGQVDPVEYRD
jgi:diguanylate cyclase (GGDEF)-like protein/PAS domain S-box-containing protein